MARDVHQRYRLYKDTETGDGTGYMIMDLQTGDVVRRYKANRYNTAVQTEAALNSGKRKA